MTSRTCEVCGELLPLQTGRGGRRKRCATCPRPPRNRTRPKAWTPAEILKPPSDLDSPGPTCERTRAFLLAADVWTHPMAAAAMALAERIDSGQEPGTALASLAGRLQDVLNGLQAAASSEPAPPDPLEEIRERVRRRIAG
jgi:hypothetical protein